MSLATAIAEAEACLGTQADTERLWKGFMAQMSPLKWLGDLVGIEVYEGDPQLVAASLGKVGASPYAQACSRGVCVVALGDPACAYSVCHELAHLIVGLDKPESYVLGAQVVLARMLREPWRSRAMPDV